MSVDIDTALASFRERGWARLGKLADDATIAELRARADAIMLGEISYPGLFFQHDAESGRYEDLEYGKGWKGPSLRYRKVEKLELDPVFWSWIDGARFAEVARRVYGESVTLYRAFLMNKHAGGGTDLPWHQDGGNFWGLDRDPILTIWTALDDLPAVAGEVILLHNHVWHRSGRTKGGSPRRALSVCYMHGATKCVRRKRAPRTFVRMFTGA
jgi:hypothetical protein